MKKFLLPLLALLLIIPSAYADYSDVKNLEIDSSDLRELQIDCAAGFLEVKGIEGFDRIEIEAEIVIEGLDEDEALDYIDRYMVLKLDKQGKRAVLESFFDNKISWNFFGHRSQLINLTIRMPLDMELTIDDGSGYIYIEDINGKVDINDGSGEITLLNIGNEVRIEDGSGEIDAENILGDVDIEDGSGSIELSEVVGEVLIDDGSGSIKIRKVEGDVDVDDGSGSMSIEDINGSVLVDDGSGDIRIDGVTKDVRIVDAGSGGTRIRNVDGRITGDVDI